MIQKNPDSLNFNVIALSKKSQWWILRQSIWAFLGLMNILMWFLHVICSIISRHSHASFYSLYLCVCSDLFLHSKWSCKLMPLWIKLDVVTFHDEEYDRHFQNLPIKGWQFVIIFFQVNHNEKTRNLIGYIVAIFFYVKILEQQSLINLALTFYYLTKIVFMIILQIYIFSPL